MKNKKIRLIIVRFILLPLSCCLIFTGCVQKSEPISQTGFYFNTVITITLYDSSQSNLLKNSFDMAKEYEGLFDKTNEGSDVSRINRSNGRPVTVSADTVTLLQKAIYYARLADGLVDPTIGSISSLWDFSDNTLCDIPSDDALREACSHVNYRNIILDEEAQTVTLIDPLAHIDLGFIAKGYIADRIKEYLTTHQVRHGVINLGGNVVVIGSKPDGTAYNVGIQEPFAATGTAALTLRLSNRSAVSSGNYERYFIKDDVLYHHILNPKNGYPADSGLSSVTILSEHSVDGDALSTLTFILGLEKGRQLIESLPDTGAIFITKDGQQHTVNYHLN